MKEYKVVFHIDEMDKWNLTIGNIKNILKELNELKATIVVLVNSKAVNGYLDQKLINSIIPLAKKKVNFKVCMNSLNNNKILLSNIKDFIIPVGSGVFELMRLQNMEGFAYIKP